MLNADLIEHVEATPDTVISLTTGAKFVVQETADDVIEQVVAYQRSVHQPGGRAALQAVPTRFKVPHA